MATTVAGRGEPDGAPRLLSLDVLRGIAILGILFMNIPEMGGTWAAAYSPRPDLLGWTPIDRIVWWVYEVFATGTARGMLQFLFGAGLVILTGRLATRAFCRRQLVLLVFGLVHVWLLLWAGDILHVYAVCAMIAFPLRRLPPRWLVLLGLVVSGYGTFSSYMGTTGAVENNRVVAEARAAQAAGRPLTAQQTKELKSLDDWHAEVAGTPAKVAAELAERQTLAGQAHVTWREWLARYTRWQRVLNMYATSLGAILIGVALYRWGILQGERSRGFYARMAIGWYAIGLGARIWGAWVTSRLDDTVTIIWAFDEYWRLATTLGHVGVIGWLLTSVRGQALLRPFAAAGRTALTIYILQTILCVWVIYPSWGLGLLGKQGWAGLMRTAALINAVLLVAALWWMQRYAIAPVEWAWRSLTAGRRLAFRRT